MSNITSQKFRKGKIDIILTGGGGSYSNVEVKENGGAGSGNGKLYIGYGPNAPVVTVNDSIVIINTTESHISSLINIGAKKPNPQMELVVTDDMQQPLMAALIALTTTPGSTPWAGPLTDYFIVKKLD